MSGFGPQLPAHLVSSSSSSTTSAGPQLPSTSTSPNIGAPLPSTASSLAKVAAGPTLPPHLAAATSSSTSTNDRGDDSDSSDDFSPALPPDLAASRTSTTTERKILGPTLPPSFAASSSAGAIERPATKKKETPLSALYSDDSDDDFGPRPLPSGSHHYEEENEGVRLVREREEREKERAREEERKRNEKPKRDEWMMVPPKEMDLMSSIDTTKLKSRGFAQSAGKGINYGSSTKEDADEVNLWTETPQERQQRLEDEMMGRKRKAEISNGGGGPKEEEDDESRRKRMRDRQLREEVERHNKSSRATSLLDQHGKASKSKSKDGKDDKGPPGIWDHERDMSVGGRLLDDSKRKDMIKNARDLGGRFGGGSFL